MSIVQSTASASLEEPVLVVLINLTTPVTASTTVTDTNKSASPPSLSILFLLACAAQFAAVVALSFKQNIGVPTIGVCASVFCTVAPAAIFLRVTSSLIITAVVTLASASVTLTRTSLAAVVAFEYQVLSTVIVPVTAPDGAANALMLDSIATNKAVVTPNRLKYLKFFFTCYPLKRNTFTVLSFKFGGKSTLVT